MGEHILSTPDNPIAHQVRAVEEQVAALILLLEREPNTSCIFLISELIRLQKLLNQAKHLLINLFFQEWAQEIHQKPGVEYRVVKLQTAVDLYRILT